MVAFRNLFPVLAIVGLLLGSTGTASAQTVGQTPLTCTANAGVPPIVRAEGFTELVGDIVLTCTGGAGVSPFLANFQIFLNTNITSRLVTGDFSEALLLVDEPGVPRQTGGPAPLCLAPASVAGYSSNTVGCNPAAAGATYQTGTYTAFRGVRAQQGQNAIVWPGIPVTPPGTVNATRIFRFTNIRANAAGLGTSSTLIPTQIVAFVSISSSQSLAVNNAQPTVAYIQRGLQFDVRTCTNESGTQTFSQCVSTNAGLFNNPSLSTASTEGLLGLRFREGFQTAFKPRIEPAQEDSDPGEVFNSESGFVRTTASAGSDAFGIIGRADSGTRVAARFNNVPAGVRLFVTTGATPRHSTAGVTAQLVSADAVGSGGTAVAGSTSLQCIGNIIGSTQESGQAAAEVSVTNGTGVAVWEITGSNSALIDTAFFYLGVAYQANTPNKLPGVGQSTVTGNFAPFYAASNTAAAQMSSSLPIPRFLDDPQSSNTFRINPCVTNLLFPFVTNAAGFDTGIAISNTSSDPFTPTNGRQQAGTCTLNYYGATPPPAQTTNAEVPAGGQLTFVLSSGGGLGIAGTPGFQGYIIAQCQFQYAHGFAFITDGPIGQARVAEGYLALVMDDDIAGVSRTGSQSEVLAH